MTVFHSQIKLKNRHRLPSIAALFCLVILISSCSTSHKQAIKYYQLEHPAVEYQQTSKASTILINAIQIPSFYNGRGIVMQTSQYQRTTSDWNLWADAPDKMLARHLTNQLRHALPKYLVINQSEFSVKNNSASNDAIIVSIHLNSLYGDIHGKAIMSGEIVIEKQGSLEPISFNHFNHSVSLDADGYSGLVKAIEQSWYRLGEQVKSHIEQ